MVWACNSPERVPDTPPRSMDHAWRAAAFGKCWDEPLWAKNTSYSVGLHSYLEGAGLDMGESQTFNTLLHAILKKNQIILAYFSLGHTIFSTLQALPIWWWKEASKEISKKRLCPSGPQQSSPTTYSCPWLQFRLVRFSQDREFS